jgi:hypothetical protein
VDVARLLEGEDRRSLPEGFMVKDFERSKFSTFSSVRVLSFLPGRIVTKVRIRMDNVPIRNNLPGSPDESFRVFRFHMLRQEEVPVDLVHIVVGLGEVRVQGVDRLLAIVRKQRRNLGKNSVVNSGFPLLVQVALSLGGYPPPRDLNVRRERYRFLLVRPRRHRRIARSSAASTRSAELARYPCI